MKYIFDMNINALLKGFKQAWVNHERHFKDPETDVHTNNIEGRYVHC